MSEAASIWFFFSILAICFTWYKIAAHQNDKPHPAHEMKFFLNGKPLNGSIEVTADNKTRCYKVVDGALQ